MSKLVQFIKFALNFSEVKLKELEIKGFKSFADKTKIIFDNQITGIVGPNGCGKSNIVDAIRWVIGEHKISALRSENLDGLVFNGSKSRPASAMAEVSLTFENDKGLLPSDYNTITITRKFYKNGESEYKLNDVSCRLKDIHNLFLDTGVSSDSYAIIELGMVDDIIKDKDNARRRMLEQAAGISIYKTRKKEAQQKLKATEQDLSRIEDLLHEIKANMKILESQAKKAEKYKSLKEEYKDASIKFAHKSLANFNNEFQELNRTITKHNDQKFQLEKQIEEKEENLSISKNQLQEKEQILNSVQKVFNDLLREIASLEQDRKLNAQKLSFQIEKENIASQFIEQAEGQLEELNSAIKILLEQHAEEEEWLNIQKQSGSSIEQNLENQKLVFEEVKSKLQNIKNNRLEVQNRLITEEKNQAVLESKLVNFKTNKELIQSEKVRRNESIALLENEIKDVNVSIEEIQSQIENTVILHEEIKTKLLSQQEHLEDIRVGMAEANRSLDAKKNEYNLLKSLVESMEGYPDSIRFLGKNKSWSQNFVLLSDIILPKEKYKKAIETVLQPFLNYFVVQNEEEALRAIQLLKQENKGKASFLVLNKIKSENFSIQNIGILATKVVECDEKYAKLCESLLGNVYIGDTISIGNQYTIVSEDGTILQNGWKLTGGSIGAFEGNKIGRAKGLEKIDAEIIELEKIVTKVKFEYDALQTQIQNSQEGLNDVELSKLKGVFNQKQQGKYNLSNKLEQLQRLEEENVVKLQNLEDSLATSELEYKNSSSIAQELKVELEKIVSNELEILDEYAQAEELYIQANDKWKMFSLELNTGETKLHATSEKTALRNQQLNALNEQLEFNKNSKQETHILIEQATKMENDLTFKIEEEFIKRGKKQEELDKLDQEFHNFKKIVSEAESELNKFRREKEQNDILLQENKDKLSHMKLQVTTMNERMKIEFNIDLDSILNEEMHIEEEADILEDLLDKIKQRIGTLGEVNHTALEAFQEVSERFAFISEQKNDLVQAKNNLVKTIDEVETTANMKFLDTFDRVRENFKNVFQALFTEEDTCDIKLTDPNNLSDTGIEIFARPKGKKPAAITQLSGGEKTLTSTALLFAIYLIKPAPFCILDEVDAPLDDANVEKFTNMIRQFSNNSQFIIVTHNKQTMSSVDAIYGVTMQEMGVSKIVPVDFRNLN